MRTTKAFLPQADDLLISIKETHRRLIDSLDADTSILVEGTPARTAWLRDADCFLTRIQSEVHAAKDECNSVELEWFAHAASEWQLAMSGRLNLPRDIRDEIGLEPESRCLPDEKIIVVPKATWNHANIEQFLRREAFSIGANRKILTVMRRFFQLRQMQPQRIHDEIPSNELECWQDWYSACRFLTLDVILGRINFARLIDPSGYEFLETVWLDDVKQLHAYLLWEKSNSECGFQAEDTYYFPACEQIDKRLFCNTADVTVDIVVQWWKERYLIGTNSPNGDAIEDVIRRKSNRVWEKTGSTNENANRYIAERYVDSYYFHLIPAVQEKDPKAVRTIYEALQCRGENGGCELINGLEAAIASSFIDFSDVERL